MSFTFGFKNDDIEDIHEEVNGGSIKSKISRTSSISAVNPEVHDLSHLVRKCIYCLPFASQISHWDWKHGHLIFGL